MGPEGKTASIITIILLKEYRNKMPHDDILPYPYIEYITHPSEEKLLLEVHDN